MTEPTGTATARVMATTKRVMDVELLLTTIGGQPTTLVMTAESIAQDAKAQQDQAQMLLNYLASDSSHKP